MNKFYSILLFFFIVFFINDFCLIAQPPMNFNYQVVIRDANGNVMANTKVGIWISILQNGSAVCVEEFNLTTNGFGLAVLTVGSENPTDFAAIDWSNGNYSIKTEIDLSGGTDYVEMGITPLQSVPFALHSKTAENVFSGQYDDLQGKPDLSIYLTSEVDGDPTNEIELPTNASTGDMCYFDGSKWSPIEKPTNPDFRYSLEWDFNNNKPYWKAQLPSIVFNGQTLYVYPTDNSSGAPWYNGTYITTNANSTTDGEVNTVIIVTSQGEGSYAAKICADLVAYGYDDWY